MELSRVGRFVVRRLRRPPGWPLLGTTAILLATYLAAVSAPGSYFDLYLLAILAAWVLVPLWLARAGLAALLWLFSERGPPTWSSFLRWMACLLAFWTVVLVETVPVPLIVTYRLSRPALARAARHAMDHPERFPPRPLRKDDVRRIGLFPIERTEAFPGGARFIVAWTGFSDRCGFAYSEAGEPPNLGGEDHYSALRDDWYLWRESW
jgi:hypothetical protein